MFTKLKLLFKGGGKIDLTPILKNVRDIEIEPFNNEGGSVESGGFDLDAFKQNIANTYNKIAEASITKDNIIIPDAFIIDENFNYEDNPNTHIPHFVDTDLTEFLASFALHVPNVCPLYLKDSFDENNFYFGIYGNDPYRLDHHTGFGPQRNFDNISDNAYDGNLDLNNYEYLYNLGLV